MKEISPLVICVFSLSALAAENNINNVLNGNGSVGNVTITQENSMTNEKVAAQERIDSMLKHAYEQRKAGTPSKEANEKSLIAGAADEINKQPGTMSQKNRLCKSKASVSADVLGYNLDLAFRTCDELFIVQ
jgi:high-affinity K+ transport system ATPase subunit B